MSSTRVITLGPSLLRCSHTKRATVTDETQHANSISSVWSRSSSSRVRASICFAYSRALSTAPSAPPPAPARAGLAPANAPLRASVTKRRAQ